MPINERTEETDQSRVAQADRRVERAKASLLSRVDELKSKLGDARSTLDVKGRISQHPLPAVAIAFALGALAGLRDSGTAEAERPARSLSGAALWAISALSVRLLRELAVGHLGELAKQWWSERQGEPLREPGMASTAGREPFGEP